jgi:hypothetical protein
MSSFHAGEIGCSILASRPTGLGVIDMQKIVSWRDGAERTSGRCVTK